MSNFQELLDESFIEQLNYEYVGNDLPTPEIEGSENILNYSKEYQGNGVDGPRLTSSFKLKLENN